MDHVRHRKAALLNCSAGKPCQFPRKEPKNFGSTKLIVNFTSPRMILLLPSGIIPAAFFGKKGSAKMDVGKLAMNSKRSSEISCIFVIKDFLNFLIVLE